MAAELAEGQEKESSDAIGVVPPRLFAPGPSVMVALAAVFRRLSAKELAANSRVSYRKILNFLRGAVQDELLPLVRALKLRPAEVRILDSCIKAWSDLDTGNFSDDELELIELEAAEAATRRRVEVMLALRGGGAAAQARDIAAERARGEELRVQLADLKRPSQRLALVKVLRRYHNWAFAVSCAEHSLWQASKNPGAAVEWAELSILAATAAGGNPSGLTSEALRGWCGAHLANALRVQGDLPASDAEMGLHLHLWKSGSDPAVLLDPGRVYELAASLRIDQRRTDEALRYLELAEPVTRRPAHLRLQRGRTLSTAGKYKEAVVVLEGAESLVEAEGDLRLINIRKFNLVSLLVYLERYDEAALLLPEIRRISGLLGDALDLNRANWLEGRILKGLGELEKAVDLLATVSAVFEGMSMDFDAALARFEEARLHMELGRPGRAAEIAGDLVGRFEAQGIHEEAAKARGLFQQAAPRTEHHLH